MKLIKPIELIKLTSPLARLSADRLASLQACKLSLVHPVPEEPRGYREIDDTDEGHRPELTDEEMKRSALKEYASEDHHEVAHGIEKRNILYQLRHVCDRGGKAGQDDGRDKEEERPEKALLLRHCEGRDH